VPTFDPVPSSLDVMLDTEWLSRALGDRHVGCDVVSVGVRESRSTVASKHFLETQYRNPGVPPAPRRLCIKGYFDDAQTRARAGESEARFYRDCSQGTSARIPACSYAALDEGSGSSVLILEDLAASGAVLLDARHRIAPDLAAATLRQLALRHAETWNDPRLGESWLAPRMSSLAQSIGRDRLQELLDRPRADGLDSATRTAERVQSAMLALADLPEDSPRCMLHGDTHAGNIYSTPDGPGLLDWQLVQRGGWATDVAYHIGSALETEERRRVEWDLLRFYLGCLVDLGITPPSWESAATAYRQHLAYGLFLWAMTQFTPEELTTITLRRLGRAVEDHHTFELLGV